MTSAWCSRFCRGWKPVSTPTTRRRRIFIDDGQFGAAYVLTAFNYAQGENFGVELSTKYKSGPFQAYGNLAVARQIATQPVSNQFLFDNATPLADLGGLTQFQYLQTHWVFTDHNQWVTASAGAVYQFCGRPAYAGEMFNGLPGADGFSWCGTRLSGDMIYGSGLRDGDANISRCRNTRKSTSASRANSCCPTIRNR